MAHDSIPPHWLNEPSSAVLQDLQGARPIAGLTVVASSIDGMNGLSLGVCVRLSPDDAPSQLRDDLDPDQDTSYGGGNWVPRSLAGPQLIALVADIMQEDLAETEQGWAQARPPCPHHPHPARPVVRNGEAWWICERLNEPLYRIGQGEVPTRLRPAPTWEPQTRRSRKRKHAM